MCLANPSETQQPLALFLGLDLCLSSLCSALSEKQGKENLHVGGLYGRGRNPAEVLTPKNPTHSFSFPEGLQTSAEPSAVLMDI